MSYTSKNAYSADKTSKVYRGGTSGANRGYVLTAPTKVANSQDEIVKENKSDFIN